MIVEVITEDIEKAKIDMALFLPRIRCCPVAQALMRQCPNEVFYVYDSTVETSSIEGGPFDLPLEAQRFIKDFDTKQPVEPISFEISNLFWHGETR